MTLDAWIFATLQVVLGGAIVLGAKLTLLDSVDKLTKPGPRFLMVALFFSGFWYSFEPLILGFPTSTKPGLMFAACVAWALLRHRDVVRAALQTQRNPRPTVTPDYFQLHRKL